MSEAPSFISRNFQQEVTYWALTSLDKMGEGVYAVPVVFNARWVDKAQQIVSPVGEELVATAEVRVPRELVIGGMLAQGDYSAAADPSLVSGAREIMAFRKVPDLRNAGISMKAFL